MPAADSNKFVTNSLPEFLLLAAQLPETVFTLDEALLRDLHMVIVCYDAQVFYRNRSGADGPAVSLDDFKLYCDSKIQPQQLVEGDDGPRDGYQCLMTISDLMRTESWAQLYSVVGPRVMRRLLFDCLLFVPLGRHVYYCVRSPSQLAGRYEVLQAFRARAGSRWKSGWTSKSKSSTQPQKYFNIAGLLRDMQPIGRQNSADMLDGILHTDVDGVLSGRPPNDRLDNGGGACFDRLARKLKVMADKDTSRAYWNIYRDTVGDCASAEVPLNRVKSFTRAVVRKIVPRELFGTAGNRDQFCDNLCRVLNGGKFHDYAVQHVMHKIKIKKIRWLDSVAADWRAHIATKTFVWLTNVFVFGRIVHCFRVVTTTTPINGVAYVAKIKWADMCREKISPLMSSDSEFFRQIHPENTETSSYRNWKVCPYAKTNGVRLIFKLRRKVGANEKRLIDDCLTFLRCLSRTWSSEYQSVTRPQFFRGWKALQESRRLSANAADTLFYVRTDFRDAFTSFVHDKLRTVVRDRIKERFGKKQRMVAVHTLDVVKIGGGTTTHCNKRRYVGGLPAPVFQAGSLVFHDKTDMVPLFRIWDAVRRCIECNAVERGGRLWAMTRGVVQGDRLSVALCDLLLSDLHATRLTDLVDGRSGGRLYRFVDDYLFVSPNRDDARRYLAAMRAGFEEYGLRLNRSKTETNVDDDGGGGMVRFLGFRLNAATGEVTKDSSAYRNQRPLHFFDYCLGRGQPGRALYAKVGRPNWHAVPAVLVSKSFNSAAVVARNVASVVAYKAFAVVTAVKQYFFHLNPTFLVNTVRAVARIVYSNARAAVWYSAVTPMQCKWIVYEVYATMFRAHFSPDDRRVASAVHRIRVAQTAVGRKCATRLLRAALRRKDFSKIFG